MVWFILLALVASCSAVNPAREACYAKSRAAFVVDQEECEDEACVDKLLERRKAEQEACP